ncbi:MAG: hypothetical protein HQK53_19240, partial [Oligoflexia bacterium]|nr:hypothetical protein [Oligoflexia bacterium]
LEKAKENETQIRTPAQLPGIFTDFINGQYRYIVPNNKLTSAEVDEQIIDALNPLLETPFLQVSREDLGGFIGGLNTLSAKMSASPATPLSNTAGEKMITVIRNARFGGAKNRFHRSSSDLERAIGKFSSALKVTPYGAFRSIPEFAVIEDPQEKLARNLAALPQEWEANGAVVSLQRFKEKYLFGNDTFYHGTPDIKNVVSILRGGSALLGTIKFGSNNHGRGVYTTDDRSVASGFARTDGLIATFKIKKGQNPIILDIAKISNLKSLKEFATQARAQGIEPFEALRRKYGVDIIINTHILIQNFGVVDTFVNDGTGEGLEDHLIKRQREFRRSFTSLQGIGPGGPGQ